MFWNAVFHTQLWTALGRSPRNVAEVVTELIPECTWNSDSSRQSRVRGAHRQEDASGSSRLDQCMRSAVTSAMAMTEVRSLVFESLAPSKLASNPRAVLVHFMAKLQGRTDLAFMFRDKNEPLLLPV